MAEFRSIAISQIHVPERLRAVEDDHALAIQASIIEHGLINPITVRPHGDSFMLIAGAHRLRAIELNDEAEIDAFIVEADDTEAMLIEVTENLFRNELSVLDRAMFVLAYREAWERKHGEVKRGPKGISVKLTEIPHSPVELIQNEAASGFSTHAADRLGLSTSAIERAQFIGQRLHADLRRALRGQPEAHNQSLLKQLARMEPEAQQTVARAYVEERDMKAALASVGSPKEEDPDKDFTALVAAWTRAGKKDRDRFLSHIGASLKKAPERHPKVSDVVAAAKGGESIVTDPRQVTIFDVISKAGA